MKQNLKILFISISEREREHTSGGGGQREIASPKPHIKGLNCSLL